VNAPRPGGGASTERRRDAVAERDLRRDETLRSQYEGKLALMSFVAPLSLLSATLVLDSSFEGWTLLDPSADGVRSFRYEVVFGRPFSSFPVVHVGLVGLDVSKDDNLRVRVRALEITSLGFTLQVETWLNTKIWSVETSWLAIGS
jgi:hypothetical protein